MNEITKRIDELRKEINRLDYEIRELERQNSNFYIGVCDIGNGDYWDEYYHRLGFISEENAKAWVSEQLEDEDVYDARYFEVTAEIHNKYNDWVQLDKLKNAINRYNSEIDKLDGVDVFEETVDKAIKALAKEIGIRHLSFMHPSY